MEYLQCLVDKAQEMVLSSQSSLWVINQAMAIRIDLVLLAAHAVAIFKYKRKGYAPLLISFIITIIAFQSPFAHKIYNYQMHIVYLIIFSFSVQRYYETGRDLFFKVCAVMVIFQGIMVADAFLFDYETVLYILYPYIYGAIHIAFIIASFGVGRLQRYSRRMLASARRVKAVTYSFMVM